MDYYFKRLDVVSNNVEVHEHASNLAYISDFQPRRGRPRILPQMGEFDLSLISEFRSRPSFYDRNSPQFRDKLYNAHQWQEISNKLGFDVSILKDRILQLRNRYNLEKRRIEQLREENPNKFYDSPWPLYDHLHFLSDHIRARRSYKKMVPLNGSGTGAGCGLGPYATAPELSNSCSNNSNLTLRHGVETEVGGSQHLTSFPNGLLTVKMEDNSDGSEEETESQNNESEINAFETAGLIPNSHSSSLPTLRQQQQHSSTRLMPKLPPQSQPQKPPTISIRRLESLKPNFADPSSNYNKKLQYRQVSQNGDDSVVPRKKSCLSVRELKYNAFGNFISSSLRDLPPVKSLELVQKFTSDIVKVLMENAQQEQQQEELHREQQQQQQCNNFEN